MDSAKLTCLRKGGLFAGDQTDDRLLGLKPLTWGHIHARIVFSQRCEVKIHTKVIRLLRVGSWINLEMKYFIWYVIWNT